MKLFPVLAASVILIGASSLTAQADPASMSFFITSAGMGHGANLGGLDGADAYCGQLAKAAGSAKTSWHAYLSTTAPEGKPGINARDRIGKGPWMNVKGDVVAKSVEDLHSDANNITKDTALTEKGEKVNGKGDQPNTHDMLTGSDPQGLYSTAGGDTTCKNWTSDGEGSAILGHHDRQGLADSRQMHSWNSAHGSAGCSQDALVKTGGSGLFYCFAAE
ncbi:lectin [Aestuariivirga litoralis]|uniref:lectin n=1 Tax=Aestuariivirga litoralis TaxID=2650924 RepID=UPI0018C825ED|nr:lectin [Aestuariivirga litoralis]MBG1231455.1 lectin [Aestuariivirga litoralis]